MFWWASIGDLGRTSLILLQTWFCWVVNRAWSTGYKFWTPRFNPICGFYFIGASFVHNIWCQMWWGASFTYHIWCQSFLCRGTPARELSCIRYLVSIHTSVFQTLMKNVPRCTNFQDTSVQFATGCCLSWIAFILFLQTVASPVLELCNFRCEWFVISYTGICNLHL